MTAHDTCPPGMAPPTDVIFHGGCPDGMTAAWLIWDEYPDVRLWPWQYQERAPSDVDLLGMSHVVITDFSFDADTTHRIARQVSRLTVLDHHASAIDDLGASRQFDGLGHVQIVLDHTRSGARITWDWLHGHTTPPPLVAYVEDRDLWRHTLPATEAIAALVSATPYTLEAWDHLARDVAHRFGTCVAAGSAVLGLRRKLIDEQKACARIMDIAGIDVPAAPAPYPIGSDLAGELAETSPHLVGGYYIDRPDCRQFGLRAAAGGPPVHLIAAQYVYQGRPGGGHPTAAGFRVPWGHPLAPHSLATGGQL